MKLHILLRQSPANPVDKPYTGGNNPPSDTTTYKLCRPDEVAGLSARSPPLNAAPDPTTTTMSNHQE
ncbi:hypothetical protein ACMWQU_27165, partial [Escherichia coli]|uniref:hypothetical protein n=1 Tax=Escherichia coli TaxID=562 RepID=UPI0039E09B32